MGKTTKVSQPTSSTYKGGQLNLNGEQKAKTYLKNGELYIDYNMSPYEKAAYDHAQKSMMAGMPAVNSFSPETVKGLSNQIEAYTNRGIKSINNIYDPMIKELQNDIANRFGNLDNSIFMNNIDKLENNRSIAISDLSESVQAKRNELISDELENRYNYLNFLNNYQNQVVKNTIDLVGLNQNGIDSLNNFNLQNYQNKVNAYRAQTYSDQSFRDLLYDALIYNRTTSDNI